MGRVLAEHAGISFDLVALRSSIETLQIVSLELDEEKVAPEKNFWEALKRLPNPPRPQCDGGFARCAVVWYQAIFESPEQRQDWADLSQNLEDAEKLYRFPFPKNPWGEFPKAVKRLVRANAKIIAFERGFLDEAGIKDREWSRHPGVAPGRWLGESYTYL